MSPTVVILLFALVFPNLSESASTGIVKMLSKTKPRDYDEKRNGIDFEVITFCAPNYLLKCSIPKTPASGSSSAEQGITYKLFHRTTVTAKAVAIIWESTVCEKDYNPPSDNVPKAFLFLEDCAQIVNVDIRELERENKHGQGNSMHSEVEAKLVTGKWIYCIDDSCGLSRQSNLPLTVWTKKTDD